MERDRHRDVMVGLARELGWRRGVEVGVGSGKLLHRLLRLGIQMVGVDMGQRPDRKAEVEAIISLYDRSRMIWRPSVQAAHLVPDGWADFVFIDAGHSHQAVAMDLAAWEPKVRTGGWFGGHDFHPAHPGVIQAVRERFGKRFNELEGWIWVRG